MGINLAPRYVLVTGIKGRDRELGGFREGDRVGGSAALPVKV